VADGIFEVTVTATVTTKVKDKVLFLVEAKQAGIFEIRNVPQPTRCRASSASCARR
jgi:preprotein translocase subunit SecB